MNPETPIQPSPEDALKSLTHATPPQGLSDRVLLRVQQQRALAYTTGTNRAHRAWWIFPAFGLGGITIALFVLSLSGVVQQRTGKPPVTNISSTHLEAPVTAPLAPVAHASAPHEQHRREPQPVPRPIPSAQTTIATEAIPPVLPLSSQERLLIALAQKPALAASAVVSRPVPDHGLGTNALSDLEDQPLPSMQAALLDLNATYNPVPSGENQ